MHATLRKDARLLTLLLVATAWLAPSVGWAQSNQEKAGELYKAGIDSYFAEDYGVAITKFRAGYQLDPNAMFLYSLSLCFSKLGNFEDALSNATKAKDKGGMPPDVTTKNDARLVAFSTLVQAGEMLERATTGAENETPTCLTNSDCSDGEVCNMRRAICVAELPLSDEHSKPLFTPVGWAGVGVGAVGVGMLVGGAVTSLGVAKNEDRYATVSDPNSSEFDAAEADDLASKLDSQKSLGRVLILGGTGALLVGGALVAVDMFVLNKGNADAESTTTMQWTPTVAPGYVGTSWMLRF